MFLLAWGSLDIAQERLFKKVVGYFRRATRPCVVAYGYARIRRLVRLGVGFYRVRVAANSAIRLGTLMSKRRMTPFITMLACF